MTGPYDTPQAFRAALQARLRNVARQRGTDLQRLQRRVAFERLLARLFAGQDPPWLLKGGYALELRLPHRARSTLDLDLSVPEPERLLSSPAGDEAARRDAQIHEQLQIAAERDLDDGFQFLVRLPKRAATPGGGIRCSVEARLTGRVFARFHLDVGLGDAVLDPPEWVTGSNLLDFAGIPAAQVALYPVAQQFAEKIHAYTFPWQDRDNTRVKDLVDLVLLIHAGQVEPERARLALRATFGTRSSHPLPFQLPEPPQDWVEPYAALARDLALPAATLSQAYAYLASYWSEWELYTASASNIE
ncbi:MAG: nucleotidyl transferase AbiEii/AbiGii toxin family protein [Anaerolineae bacterium]|jgi:predicted nucleotidyltransferase component of viral defense system